jgi:hypothetical protein
MPSDAQEELLELSHETRSALANLIGSIAEADQGDVADD